MIIAVAADDPDTRFALGAGVLSRQMSRVGNTRPVSTGACIQ
jgi:hypothetical protein